MKPSTFAVGRHIGLVLLLSLLTVNTAAASGASGATAGRVTINKIVCSTEVKNLFAKCHTNRLAGADFTVFSAVDFATKATDEKGKVSFGVGHGALTIAEDPATITDGGAFVFCSSESRLGSGDVLGGVTTVSGAVAINVAVGQRVVCDWYDLISPGSVHVTIHKMDCPRTLADPFNACHGPVPVSMPGPNTDFFFSASAGGVAATTNAHGVAMTQVPTRAKGKVHLVIAEAAFAVPAAGSFVFCSTNANPASGDVLGGVVTRDGSVQFDVAAGTAITCDWYDRI